MVMRRHARRFPSRIGGMAGSAFLWKIQCDVVRVPAVVEIRQVTALTGVGRVVIISVVAGRAIRSDGQVRSRKRIILIVIRHQCGLPSSICRMT